MKYYYNHDDYYYIYACEERYYWSIDSVNVHVWDIISNFLVVAKRITDHTSLLDPPASGAPAWQVHAPILLAFLILGK